MGEVVTRSQILALEREIAHLPPVALEVVHHFAAGLYARELRIPKGTVLTGKIHRLENFNVVSKGDISVLTQEGIRRVCAGTHMVSPPGTKRVGYAHEDTVWTTFHVTDEKDVEVIESIFIAPDFAALESGANICLGQQ